MSTSTGDLDQEFLVYQMADQLLDLWRQAREMGMHDFVEYQRAAFLGFILENRTPDEPPELADDLDSLCDSYPMEEREAARTAYATFLLDPDHSDDE